VSAVLEVPVVLAIALSLAANAAGGEAARTPAPPPSASALTRAGDPDPLRFGEQAWLAAVRSVGTAAGLAAEQARIFKTSGGRYYVPSAEERTQILALRAEPATAAAVAHVMALANARSFAARAGRPARAGDLAIAHLLGLEAAIRIAAAAESAPETAAASAAPAEAFAHPAIFFAGTRARSAGEVQALFETASRPEGRAERATIAEIAPRPAAGRLAGRPALKGTLAAGRGGAHPPAVAAR
jgi:hypothetical protein